MSKRHNRGARGRNGHGNGQGNGNGNAPRGGAQAPADAADMAEPSTGPESLPGAEASPAAVPDHGIALDHPVLLAAAANANLAPDILLASVLRTGAEMRALLPDTRTTPLDTLSHIAGLDFEGPRRRLAELEARGEGADALFPSLATAFAHGGDRPAPSRHGPVAIEGTVAAMGDDGTDGTPGRPAQVHGDAEVARMPDGADAMPAHGDGPADIGDGAHEVHGPAHADERVEAADVGVRSHGDAADAPMGTDGAGDGDGGPVEDVAGTMTADGPENVPDGDSDGETPRSAHEEPMGDGAGENGDASAMPMETHGDAEAPMGDDGDGTPVGDDPGLIASLSEPGYPSGDAQWDAPGFPEMTEPGHPDGEGQWDAPGFPEVAKPSGSDVPADMPADVPSLTMVDGVPVVASPWTPPLPPNAHLPPVEVPAPPAVVAPVRGMEDAILDALCTEALIAGLVAHGVPAAAEAVEHAVPRPDMERMPDDLAQGNPTPVASAPVAVGTVPEADAPEAVEDKPAKPRRKVPKPLWVVQVNLGSQSDIHGIVRAVRRQGLPCQEVELVPMDPDLPRVDHDGPVVVYGSNALVTKVARTPGLGWAPGVWFDESRFTYEAWAENYGELLLNDPAECEVTTIAAFAGTDRPDDDMVFMRPVSDLKDFNGEVREVWEARDWCRDVARGGYPMLGPDTRIVVGPPHGIAQEWRMFVVDGRVVAASQYREKGRPKVEPGAPDDVRAFAETVAARWSPAPAFCLDVCRSGNGLYVVEAQCLNCAGFYDADLEFLVRAVSVRAAREWVERTEATR